MKVTGLRCVSECVGLTSHSTHNRSFRRRVFPGNQLHWYWQPKTIKHNNWKTQHYVHQKHKRETEKTALANKTIYTLIWYGFYNLWSGNGVGLFLQPRSPHGAWFKVKIRRAKNHVCLSVCLSVCPVCALTSGNLDLQTLFFAFRFMFQIYRSSSCIKVISSRSRSQQQISTSVCPVYALTFECLNLQILF